MEEAERMSVCRFRLSEVLRLRAEAARRKPKRLRTRLALLAAVAAEIEEVGYAGLTIDRVVERAGLARGTFYIYFSNRSDAALAVRRSFNAMLRKYRPRGGRGLTAYQSIYRTNLYYIGNFAENALLLAGNEALMRDRPELARSRDVRNNIWAGRVLRDLCRRLGQPEHLCEDPAARLAIRAILGMADEFMRELYVYNNALIGGFARDEAVIAEILTFVWYRAIFGCQPKEGPVFLPSGRPK